MSNEAAYREAVQRWIDNPFASLAGKVTQFPTTADQWHRMLAYVLASGDRDTISARLAGWLLDEQAGTLRSTHR